MKRQENVHKQCVKNVNKLKQRETYGLEGEIEFIRRNFNKTDYN